MQADRQAVQRSSCRWWCEGKGPWLRSRADVVAHAAVLRGYDREELWALALDASGRARAELRLTGDRHSVRARPAELLGPVLAAGASRLILVHNHPSGDPRPSAQDVAFTQRVAAAARLLGIALCDHVVVSSAGWRSVLALGQTTSTVTP